ncbi:unnamed protein product [Brassica oleracea]
MPVQPTIVGQETMFERVWIHLMEGGVEIVGMYGMGGVGCFEVIIWVVVSKTPEIHRIQGDIAKKLGLDGGEEWDQKNENREALIYTMSSGDVPASGVVKYIQEVFIRERASQLPIMEMADFPNFDPAGTSCIEVKQSSIRLAGSTMSGFVTSVLDQAFTHLCSCFGVEVNYVWNHEKNLAALEDTMKVLRARRADVLTTVQRQESEGLQRLNEVEVWLTSVENIQNQVYDLLLTRRDELEKLCICGLCTKKLSSSHSYGKRVFEMLKKVEVLESKGVFEAIAVAVERPLPKTIVGQEKMLKRAMEHLMDHETGIMGLYGMGGVGKTTLLEQINNKFIEHPVDGVEIVIFVVVSSELRVEMIQDAIAEKLGFLREDWKQKEKSQKVADLYARMKTMKFVLLLDDIWKEVDLKEIGVPFPTRENGCKVVFTTRSREVCGQMRVDDPMEVKCLESNEAWDLFRSNVGKITLESHPDILELFKNMAVLSKLEMEHSRMVEINVKRSTPSLNKSPTNVSFPNLSTLKSIYWGPLPFPRLKKFRIDRCPNLRKLPFDSKSCSRAGEELVIHSGERDWIDKVEWEDEETKERFPRSIGPSETETKLYIKVIQFRFVIACEFLWSKSRLVVSDSWTSNLSQLLYSQNICIDRSALSSTTSVSLSVHLIILLYALLRFLCYLGILKWNSSLRKLPKQVSELVSLRYFDLSWKYMKRLPLGLQELKKLVHLRLDYMKRLKSVSGILKLSSLRKLQLLESKMSLDMSLMEELQLLEHLQVLNISIKSSLVVEKLLYAPRTSRSNNKPGENAMSVNIIPFQKLESLRLHNLATLKNIYWEPLPFPCLKTIHVTECPELRKLPLDSQSVFRVEEFVIKYKEEEWFERVEWDDEATRLRFLPFLKFFGPEWQVR